MDIESKQPPQLLSMSSMLSLFTSAKGYVSFIKAPLWQVIIFSIVSIVISGSLWSAKVIARDLPQLTTNLLTSVEELNQAYPQGLEIRWDGLQLTTNQEEIQKVSFPGFIDTEAVDLPETLVTFIPSEFNPDNPTIQTNQTFFVIDTDQIFVEGQNQTWTGLQLNELLTDSSFSYTQEALVTDLQNLISSEQTMVAASVLVVVISPVIIGLGMVWNAFTQWLLTYLVITKLYRLPLTGQQLARLAVPLTAISSLLVHLAELLYGSTPVPLFSLTYWIVLMLIIQSMKVVPKQSS